MADVALVNMPLFSTERPSLALGLLKAGLARRDISADVYYPNLQFAELIGPMAHASLELSSTTLLVGEWLFSRALWPAQDNTDAFRDLLNARPDFADLAEGLELTPDQLQPSTNSSGCQTRSKRKRRPVRSAF